VSSIQFAGRSLVGASAEAHSPTLQMRWSPLCMRDLREDRIESRLDARADTVEIGGYETSA
jgi:hypothetical protein